MHKIISRFSGSKLLVAGLLVGGSLGTFGYAAATSSPSTTVFYACLNVKAGTMNSINTTGAPKCGKGNVNTSWNAIGPKGDTGSQGVAGQQGVTGPQGPKGDTGSQGATGSQGPKGDTGSQGTQGVKGDTGPVISVPSGSYFISSNYASGCISGRAGGYALVTSDFQPLYLCPF